MWVCCAVLLGGYGGMRDDLVLDPKQECIQAPGLTHVLCTSWRNDNSGLCEAVPGRLCWGVCVRGGRGRGMPECPAVVVQSCLWLPALSNMGLCQPQLPVVPQAQRYVAAPPAGPPEDVSEPLLIYDLLRQDWMPPSTTSSGSNAGGSSSTGSGSGPGGARVFASSFDAFVDEVLAALPSLNLPVVTGERGGTAPPRGLAVTGQCQSQVKSGSSSCRHVFKAEDQPLRMYPVCVHICAVSTYACVCVLLSCRGDR